MLITSFMILTTSCSAKKENNENELIVYTSFYAMYDFCSKIGGDRVTVINMTAKNGEPHDWEPTPSDIAGLNNADIFVYNGAGMEHWISEVIDALDNDNIITCELAADLVKDNETYTDPHVWLNPHNAQAQAEKIYKFFSDADPDNKDFYKKNYDMFYKDIESLDSDYKLSLADISQKTIVVTHGAFSYLCDAYGLTQEAVEGEAEHSEPTPDKLAQIIDLVNEKQIKVIFSESGEPSDVAETISRETGAKIGSLATLETDADGDYFTAMKANLQSLKEALK